VKTLDIDQWTQHGDWKILLNRAVSMIGQVETQMGAPMSPVFGGGTRLMIELGHRISHDIDLFVDNPMWVSALSPRVNDWNDESLGYDESSNFVKVRFPEGEIDFIVAPSLLERPPAPLSKDLGVRVEWLGEIIAKKLFYRAEQLAARDLFDWRALEDMRPNAIDDGELSRLLKHRLPDLEASVRRIGKSDRDRALWNAIETDRPMLLDESLEWASGRLLALKDDQAISSAFNEFGDRPKEPK